MAKILGRHVYSNKFKSHSQNPIDETKILYVNAKKTEGLNSRISSTEIREIQKITEYLKQNNHSDFVILTPYKKQVKMLNKCMLEERNDLKILTVHGSQGREWETVILSVVDTSDKWFVDSTSTISKGLNLINTAVSRAKKNLIIVCDTKYWLSLNGQLISDLIKSGNEFVF
ncbi:ATP-dependent RecD-like DNA helicase [termite gut metagenome]|uniref:ATP-dependent RecD-like DNA helicase n=1 Tax=termite gut metagenome TaxID=433724 RepID=A0A5J4QMX7_9ZZZZ